MNESPADAVLVPAPDLTAFVHRIGERAGLSGDHAALLAELLVANESRGVHSHGTIQIATYARLLRDGMLNPDAVPAVVREGPTSVQVDGDGGLGYFAAHLGTRRVIDKALEAGTAVMMTGNHGHFGAAGLYARLTLEHDLLTFVTSGHQLALQPGDEVYSAAGGSPMAFSAPTEEEDPLVLDFGTMHDLYTSSPHRDEVAALTPGLVLRSIGLGAVCQSWGGLLAGTPIDPAQADRVWPGANQGSLVVTFRIDLFADPTEFRRQMDQYVRAVRQLAPLPGFTAAHLPGGPEAERERLAAAEGVRVGAETRAALTEVATEVGATAPW